MRNHEKIIYIVKKTGQGVATLLCALNAKITVFFIMLIFKGGKQVDELYIIQNYQETLNCYIVAQNNGLCREDVLKILRRHKLIDKYAKITPDEESRICDMYSSDMDQEKVGAKFGISGVSVGRILRRNNQRILNSEIRQKYTLDASYFECIDSSQKAYIFGLLMSDGWLSKEGSRTIGISLQDSDKSILEKINRELGSNRPLVFHDYKKVKESYHNQYSLSITNDKMYHDLITNGMMPNKSLSLEYPNIENEFQNSFIRGYFDGDGYVAKSLPKIKILCTQMFAKTMQNIVGESLGINANIYKASSNDVTKSFEIYGYEKVKKFLDWIYADAGDLYIERKYAVYATRYK